MQVCNDYKLKWQVDRPNCRHIDRRPHGRRGGIPGSLTFFLLTTESVLKIRVMRRGFLNFSCNFNISKVPMK
jgi:hypothetical protein